MYSGLPTIECVCKDNQRYWQWQFQDWISYFHSLFNDWPIKITVAGNSKYKVTDSLYSLQSSLKSHSLWLTLYCTLQRILMNFYVQWRKKLKTTTNSNFLFLSSLVLFLITFFLSANKEIGVSKRTLVASNQFLSKNFRQLIQFTGAHF